MKTKRPAKVKDTAAQANERALASLYTTKGANAGNALINKFLPEGSLGRVSTDVTGATNDLSRYKSLYDTTTFRDPDQTDVMAKMKAGLDGYTSEENQAFREQQQRGVNSDYATSAAQLARAQSRGKVYGAAGVAQKANLITSTQNSKDNLEQDLLIKNADEKDRRLQEYGQYGQKLDQQEFDNRAAATKGYGDEESSLRGEELDREKVNLGQSNAELAAQIGAYTGAGSTALAQKNAEEAARIQREGIQAINGGGVASGSNRANKRAMRTPTRPVSNRPTTPFPANKNVAL